jgi:hypothetical protein
LLLLAPLPLLPLLMSSLLLTTGMLLLLILVFPDACSSMGSKDQVSSSEPHCAVRTLPCCALEAGSAIHHCIASSPS